MVLCLGLVGFYLPALLGQTGKEWVIIRVMVIYPYEKIELSATAQGSQSNQKFLSFSVRYLN